MYISFGTLDRSVDLLEAETTSPADDITINPLRIKNVTSINPSYSSSTGPKSTSAGSGKSASTGLTSAGSKENSSSSKTTVAEDSFPVSEVQSGEGNPKALKAELGPVSREGVALMQSLDRASAHLEGKVNNCRTH